MRPSEAARNIPTYTFSPTMRRFGPTELHTQLNRTTNIPETDKKVLADVISHAEKLIRAFEKSPDNSLSAFASFLPPRLVHACRDATLIPFFGSGMSIPAGIPSWAGLLERLGLSTDYVTDPHVEHDALTQAELIAHAIGTDALQQKLVDITNEVATPTLGHFLLAELRLPVYITTNYDSLFEKAWEMRWKTSPIVITNDQDVLRYNLHVDTSFPLLDEKQVHRPVLIKMHGDATGATPQLILTRSDYRRHYRSNTLLFELIKDLMSSSAVFFLGFSHRDPEVSRLVDDMVYRFETDHYKTSPHPLFSLQFDMRQRTPEVFAARGIVALRPPTLFTSLLPDAIRSLSVSVALMELLFAINTSSHEQINLAHQLQSAVARISQDVSEVMNVLSAYKDEALRLINNREDLCQLLTSILPLLGVRAGQGLFVAHDNGDVAGHAFSNALGGKTRNIVSFAPRPYFRQAQMFRSPFVSDVFESIYNKHATVFFCMPLGTEKRFDGLLFSAAQPGCWQTILHERDKAAPHDFIVVDSNGIAVIPPLRELAPRAPVALPEGEEDYANMGFVFAQLHEASRRDSHISHIVQNIVPIGLDDDVHEISSDLRLYSIVASIPGTRWKAALSKVVPAAVPRPNTEPKRT